MLLCAFKGDFVQIPILRLYDEKEHLAIAECCAGSDEKFSAPILFLCKLHVVSLGNEAF